MPYQKSKHRQHVENQIDGITAKLMIANGAGIPSDLRDYAMAAAIFLSHAEIENYFVDVLNGVAGVYGFSTPVANSLPKKLRAHLVFEKLGIQNLSNKIAARTAEADVLSMIEWWFASPHQALLDGSAVLPPISGDDIHGRFGYPSIKNIEKILRRLGIQNPKISLNREAGKDIVGILESVADLRTALAHSATLPGVSLGDVVVRIQALKEFTNAFDRVLYTHTQVTVTQQAWDSAIC